MTNPIIKKLAELSATYKPHGSQAHAIRTAENPQEIAGNIVYKLDTARRLSERHWGPGVAEIDDLLAAIPLGVVGSFDPETAPVSFLYMGISKERAFELGRKSNDFYRRLYMQHIGKVDPVGKEWWDNMSEAWFVAAAKRDGTINN